MKKINLFYICYTVLALTSCKEVKVEPNSTSFTDNVYVNLQHSGSTEDLSSVHFIDEEKGFALGTNSLLSTSDGGLTWAASTPVVPIGDTLFRFTSLESVGDNSMYITGTYGVNVLTNNRLVYTVTKTILIRSTDNGATWEDINFLLNKEQILSIKFYNAKIGLISISKKIYKTTDGGDSWSEVATDLTNNTRAVILTSFAFASATNVVAVGQEGAVYISQDGGANWQRDPNAPLGRGFIEVKFFSDTEGYIAGGGQNFPNDDKALTYKVKLQNGTLAYTDATDKYHPVYYLNGLHTSESGDKVWVCGHLGQIYASEDGAKTWSNELSKSQREETLNDVSFPSENIGYFVGEGGVILKVDLTKE